MSVIGLLLVLIIIGVVIWAINKYIPMDPAIKNIIIIVGVIIAVLYVLSAFGILHGISGMQVPSMK
jgi:small-conductance mechanosensitive channel